MSPFAPYFGEVVEAAAAIISAGIMVVSVRAYRRRPEGRYLLLMMAFVFFFVASAAEVAVVFSTGAPAALFPFLEQYLVPSLGLSTVLSILAGLAWSPRLGRRGLALVGVAIVSVSALAPVAYFAGSGTRALAVLPPGCDRQAGGFLIIASSLGYNDSIAHGAPVRSWPVLDVTRGTDVRITLCNTYSQSVGFQVDHYLERQTETIAPGAVFNVSFLANETGTFLIYCSVFSPIHVYLQGGELNVV
ncbi:MAG TPA: hypothetical protein VLX56_07245 [Nitrososphaerales archaeon]|nr:hypothetical protein [Nitrososphaerales archaeon]